MSNDRTMQDLANGHFTSEFDAASRNFRKHPSATHWRRLKIAMFLLQQWTVAQTRLSTLEPLLDAMQVEPLANWDDLVSVATTRMTLAQHDKTGFFNN